MAGQPCRPNRPSSTPRPTKPPLSPPIPSFPIVEAFTKHCRHRGGDCATSRWPDASSRLSPTAYPTSSRRPDALAELGALTLKPEANIIKLPNISASVPQLKAAIAELQSQGFALPDYPDDRRRTRRRKTRRPATTKSRAARSIRSCAKATPTGAPPRRSRNTRANTRTAWARGRGDSKTHVATMGADDFRSNEQSVTVPDATDGQDRVPPGRRRRGRRAQRRHPTAGGRSLRRHLHEPQRAHRLPRGASRRGRRSRASSSPCT